MIGARGAAALASALALAAAASLVGRQAALAQDAGPATIPRPEAEAPADPGTRAEGGAERPSAPPPLGTPGGPEAEPDPATGLDPGPEITEPDAGADLDAGLDTGLGTGIDAIAGDAVAEPDLGASGEPIGGAADLDPGALPIGGALDLDPLGLGAGARPGREFGRDLGRDLGRRPRPALGRAGERGPGGLTLAFGVGLSARVADNPELRFADEEAGGRLTADLSFGLLSQTRLQRLSLDLDAPVSLSSNPDEGDDNLELRSPRLTFAFEREGARARIGAALRYLRTDLDEARLTDIEDRLLGGLPEADDLVISGGTRTDLDAEVEIATGLGRPLGFELELRAERRSFEGTDDPDLTDRDILGAEGALRLDVSPRLTARLTFDRSRLDDATGEERENRAYGASAVYEATARTTLTAALGASEVDALRRREEDGEGGPLRRSESSGAVGSLGAVFELPRGTVSAELESELEEGGRRDTLRVARALELRPGTALSGSIGLSRGEDDEASVVADLDFAQELARGALTASLRRRAGTDEDGEGVVATRASLGLSQRITTVSELVLDLDFARVEQDGSGDESEAELRLAWRRALTPDWSLSAGYEHRRRGEEDGDASSNALFLTLGRDFVIRP